MEGESEIVKIIIVIVVLVIMVGAVIVLLSGKGGQILDSVRNVLRFGR
ncbi:MAG: hypothetical protein V1889_00595 [archaeon]